MIDCGSGARISIRVMMMMMMMDDGAYLTMVIMVSRLLSCSSCGRHIYLLLMCCRSSTKYAKKYVENASLRDLRNWCIHSRIKPFWNEAEQLLHGLMEFRGFSFNHQQQHLSQQSPELNKIVGDGITRSPDSRFSQVKDDIGYHLEERGGGDNRYEMIVQRILNYVPSYADVSKEMTAREKAGADWHQIPPYRRIQDIDE